MIDNETTRLDKLEAEIKELRAQVLSTNNLLVEIKEVCQKLTVEIRILKQGGNL